MIRTSLVDANDVVVDDVVDNDDNGVKTIDGLVVLSFGRINLPRFFQLSC